MLRMVLSAAALVVALVSVAGSPAIALEPAASWKIDQAKSKLGFSGTQTGKAFDGEFRKFDAAIKFDPDNLEGSSINVAVDTSSAVTGDRQRDSALPGSDWFASKAFPEARFTATRITATSEGSYLAEGELTIRDVTRPLSLPFTLVIEGDRAVASGEVSLMRDEFGVGRGEFETGQWVGLDVRVKVSITAQRQ